MKVIGIGDNVCDKYIHLKTMFPGGQALNFSVYAKQLGADVSYMGVFGTDQEAAHVIRTLDELGIEHGRCRQYEGENGCARVTLEDGDRVFLGSNKGGIAKERPLQLNEEDLKYISGFSHVHTSNNSHFDSQLALVKSTGVSLSYDFSGQWKEEEKVAAVAPYADYVFLSCGSVSEEEARDVCRRMKKAGCRKIIATRGSHGAVYYDGEQFFSSAAEACKGGGYAGSRRFLRCGFSPVCAEGRDGRQGASRGGGVCCEDLSGTGGLWIWEAV